MRIAVISDIHGNVAALEAVLGALEGERADAVWCLGDLVGYGPRPNDCCAAIEARAALCLVGNHDLAVLDKLDLDDFSGDAGTAARWTQGVLGPDARAFLDGLSPSAAADGVELYHGSPRDPVWEYVLTPDAAAAALEATEAPVVLVGHSHIALALTAPGGRLEGGLAPAGTEVELDGRWLLNPGSVGQPRDGDPRAAFLLLDLERRRARFGRVPYPIARTQAEMRESGLPAALAERLGRGA